MTETTFAAPILSRTALRACLYTFDLGPIRHRLEHARPEAVVATLAQLTPAEAGRVLAALPAGQQIAVWSHMAEPLRTAIAESHPDLGFVVPILACHQKAAAARPMTALGR